MRLTFGTKLTAAAGRCRQQKKYGSTCFISVKKHASTAYPPGEITRLWKFSDAHKKATIPPHASKYRKIRIQLQEKKAPRWNGRSAGPPVAAVRGSFQGLINRQADQAWVIDEQFAGAVVLIHEQLVGRSWCGGWSRGRIRVNVSHVSTGLTLCFTVIC